MSLSKIENVKVSICRMYESSGNIQFFVRAQREGAKGLDYIAGLLEYTCYQTKHGLTETECIQRAVFDSGMLLRFFGLTRADLKLVQFSEEEIAYANKCRIAR